MLKLNYIRQDDWHNPVYQDQFGKYWVDLASEHSEYRDLCSLSGNDINDGEPETSINQEYEILTKPNFNKRFEYQMLSRLKMDCDYYLGNGNRYANHLWAGSERGQIDEMKKIWNGFTDEEKPEWLTWGQIEEYEKKMII